jgi:uncharacterized protein YbaR (Trm112 family)
MERTLAAPCPIVTARPETGLAIPVEEKLPMPIDKELLAILACPKCKGDIRLAKDGNGLVCEACRLLYEIRDNIPVMLIDEAVRLDDPTRV